MLTELAKYCCSKDVPERLRLYHRASTFKQISGALKRAPGPMPLVASRWVLAGLRARWGSHFMQIFSGFFFFQSPITSL